MGAQAPSIRGEFHCHNCYSNYMEPSTRFPLDSQLRPLEQLKAAFEKGLDFIFITNHNTTKGYRQLLECQKVHPELKRVKVYPGEEVTTGLPTAFHGHLHGHILGWGLSEEIKRGLTIEETLDEIRSQGAVSCAAHPYGLTFSIRDNARLCDLVEVFNSNNFDEYSNVRAFESARRWKKLGMAGSDAHSADSMGMSMVSVRSENDMESILNAVRRGRFEIERASYNTLDYFKRHMCFNLSDPSRLLASVRKSYGRAMEAVTRYLIKRFRNNPDELWITLMTRLFVRSVKNISMRANLYGREGDLDNEAFIKKFIGSLLPSMKRGSGGLSGVREFKLAGPISMLNWLNGKARPGAANI